MTYVIVGFGRVGRRTAHITHEDGHEVVVVERDATRADRAREAGFRTVTGDGGDESVLVEAGIVDAAAVAGVTGDPSTNYAVCLVGKRHGCRTVLRVSEELSDDLYDRYAADVDDIVYPERLGAAGAKTALLGGDFSVLAELTEHLSVASVTIPESAPVVGKRVVAVDLPGEARIYAHGSADEDMRVPLPKATFAPGDQVAVMAPPAQLPAVRRTLEG